MKHNNYLADFTTFNSAVVKSRIDAIYIDSINVSIFCRLSNCVLTNQISVIVLSYTVDMNFNADKSDSVTIEITFRCQ